MKKNLFLLSIITFGFAYNGSITGVTYFEYTRENGADSFNFNRQYFNYAIPMSNNMKFTAVFDVARTNKVTDEFGNNREDTRLVMFLKKAQLDYKTKWGNTQLGLIGTNTYGVQEKNWGYRFIQKSAIDKNGFSPTTDLGIGFSKNLMSSLNVDVQYLNGEGYKSPELNFIQRFSMNINYGEMNLIKNNGINLGFVFSTDLTENSPITMNSLYGAIALKGFRVGIEFDAMNQEEQTSILTSTYINYHVNSKIDIFSRIDLMDDVDRGTYIISGLMYNCGSGLLVSPNIRNENNDIGDFIYSLNFQFMF